ncbi:nutritionally-regulated adipose and cardiac enriched protein homolog isoform X4 [Opisthocomus hoazin]|uniref:nutritionally-regulated adipose and cardiac enriched protein homolog isoform X4 n=1 Tax=Opisthocomus hoazin TaxID=30419 RepID=UPI003F539837
MSQICPAPPDPSAEALSTDDSSYPPSILRKRPSVDQAVGEKRKAERRVRFREPEEVIEHAISRCDYVAVDDTSSSGLPVLLWLSFCAVLILAIRHVAQKCWTWFMRQ